MRLAFIVPFRKRFSHLREFVPHYKRRFYNAPIYIIEQGDDKLFNRAALLNIGYKEFNQTFDYFAAHDIDMLVTKGDYSYCENPTQLATHAEQFRYKMPFPEYFGGVTLFNNADFVTLNGYSNNFWGHSGEDNEMYFNVLAKGLKISYRDCWYHCLYHPRSPDNPTGFNAIKMEQAKRPRDPDDGLTHCKYEVVAREELGGYTKLKVLL
jgi:hypothetical protein